MAKYEIEVEYTTGNSFNSHRTMDTVGWVFDTREEARDMLQHIKEHHEMYEALDNFSVRRNGGRQAVLDKYKDKAWFSAEYPETRIVYADRHISPFWIGYFEIIHNAKIVLARTEDENSDQDEISF